MKIIDCLSSFNNPSDLNSATLYAYWKEYILDYPEIYSLLDVNHQNYELVINKVFEPVLKKINKVQETKDMCIKTCIKLANCFKDYFQEEYNIVLYFGNGSGAGWYTQYQSKPSILLGIENILILNWDNELSLKALISHEFGHLIHEYYRKKEVENDKIKNHAANILYSEGFAQYFESQIINESVFPELEEGNSNFNIFVKNNIKQIAKEYLCRVLNNSEVKDFYGSWYNWNNYRQVGYYLGYYVINEISKNIELPEIAKLNEDEYLELIISVLTTAST